MKKQILIVHGGEVFDTYEDYIEFLKNYTLTLEKINFVGWKDRLQQDLGDDYQVFYPEMPAKRNAKYPEWKIWFEKFIPFIENEVIFIGNSLGSIFLAKYLSENDYPKRIKATFLLGAPFDNSADKYSLAGFELPKSLDKFENQSEKIFLVHSEDDPMVSCANVDKYCAKLPKAEKMIFKDKGHFIQEHFPEMLEKIKSL